MKRYKQFNCLTLVILAILFAQPIYSNPVSLIFDTDMDTDCDDTGALAMLHALANLGEAEILATMVSSHYQWSAPCVQVINTYYNKPDLPIGVPKKPGADTNRGSRYAKQISMEFDAKLKSNDDAPDATDVYRKILSQQEDQSVVIATVGYLTNLAYLLDSEPDHHSPLSGKELIQQKVKSLVCMGGRYPKHLDPDVFGNFKPDPQSAVKVANEWPGTIIFTGLGDDVLTGESLKNTSDQNPVKKAYQLYLGETPARPSWDLFAVLYAVRPNEPYWNLKQDGYNHIFPNGTNEWRDENNPNHMLLQVDQEQKEAIKNLMNDLIIHPPIEARKGQ